MSDGQVQKAVVRPAAATATPGPQPARRRPNRPGPGGELLDLQRTRGNRYVQRLLAQPAGGVVPAVQRRAVVGGADSPLERQAEQVARQVAGPAPTGATHDHAGPVVTERADGREGGVAGAEVDRAIARAQGGGRPLPETVRAPMEQAFGADFGAVRVHTGPGAGELSRTLGAEAFTTGHDIFFAAGTDLSRSAGRHLLAHELTHVVQQNPVGSVQRKWFGADDPAPSAATVAALAGLKRSWGTSNPKKVNELLGKRFPKGPIMSPFDLQQISALSVEAATDVNARKWLEASGLGTTAGALVYVRGGDFTRWLKLDAAQRVFYASLAWDRRIGANSPSPPPPFTLGRQMAIKTPGVAGATKTAAKNARDATIRNAFVDTLMPAAPAFVATRPAAEAAQAAASSQILTKIFLVLQRGLKVYDDGGTNAHLPTTEDVARSLAHGGRVNVRIPQLRKGQSPHAFTDWLGITQDGRRNDDAVTSRAFGTHHMVIGDNKKPKKNDGRPARRGKFVEEGGKGAAVSNTTTGGVFLYGMNVAGGGYGKFDFNLGRITADGSHGHMFLGFTAPTRKRDGALQIGMETTEPHKPSLVGYKHNWNSTEATANPESSFYGHKSAKIGAGGHAVNERMVDLADLQITGRPWETELRRFEHLWNAQLAAAAAAGNERTAYESLVGPQGARGW